MDLEGGEVGERWRRDGDDGGEAEMMEERWRWGRRGGGEEERWRRGREVEERKR